MADFTQIAREVFALEAAAVTELAAQIDDNFNRAIKLILSLPGRLVISGMGKSGHIGAKIAATLASTGTPSFFLHPAEAIHGDLGMICAGDGVLAISNSGESEEILRIIPALKARQIPLIALAGSSDSRLAREADVFLSIKVAKEACPLQLAPTSSTTASLAMGDAIAVALMRARNFRPEDFAAFHPGGSLGRKLLTRVRDVMETNPPKVALNASFAEVVAAISEGKLGMTLVVDGANLAGIITDGDLRRAMAGERFSAQAYEIMTTKPKIIPADAKATEAEELMLAHKIKELVVIDGAMLGVIQLFKIAGI